MNNQINRTPCRRDTPSSETSQIKWTQLIARYYLFWLIYRRAGKTSKYRANVPVFAFHFPFPPSSRATRIFIEPAERKFPPLSRPITRGTVAVKGRKFLHQIPTAISPFSYVSLSSLLLLLVRVIFRESLACYTEISIVAERNTIAIFISRSSDTKDYSNSRRSGTPIALVNTGEESTPSGSEEEIIVKIA